MLVCNYNNRLPCSHSLYAVSKTGGSIPRYRRCEVVNTIPEVQLLQEENLSSLTQLVRQKNSARTALAELNSVLASLSTTAQGFPLPVTLGCVNMLRNLNSRWKSNEPAVLVEGNILFQLYSNSATFTEPF
jgi:hypothetical protein